MACSRPAVAAVAPLCARARAGLPAESLGYLLQLCSRLCEMPAPVSSTAWAHRHPGAVSLPPDSHPPGRIADGAPYPAQHRTALFAVEWQTNIRSLHMHGIENTLKRLKGDI